MGLDKVVSLPVMAIRRNDKYEASNKTIQKRNQFVDDIILAITAQ